MPVQLLQRGTLLEACQYNVRTGDRRCALNLSAVIAAPRAHEHELPAWWASECIGLNQIELPLLVDDAAHLKEVASTLQAEPLDLIGLRGKVHRNSSVRNEIGIATVFRLDTLVDDLGDRDARVGITHSNTLASSEHPTCESTPLVPIIVGPVVRDDHAQT